jgi:Secretion system C-terminal sorting domain
MKSSEKFHHMLIKSELLRALSFNQNKTPCMNLTKIFAAMFFLLAVQTSSAQNNIGFQWRRTFGGSLTEWGSAMAKTTDGGFIIAGHTDSQDGDVGPGLNRDSGDIWVIKFNATGGIQWKKTYGANRYDEANDVIQTADGGYAMVCYTEGLNSGDVTGYKGGTSDIWVVKLNASGIIQWQRCVGGSKEDNGYSIAQTTDGGFVIAGNTYSNDGDVVGKPDNLQPDVWIVKLNGTGTGILWQKVFRGSKNDGASDVKATSDGGVIITGATNSNDIDFTGNGNGNFNYADAFLIKLDNTGATTWKQMYHNDWGDVGLAVIPTSDNGYLFCGFTENYADSSNLNLQGNAWIVKTNSTGVLTWKKTIETPADTISTLNDVIQLPGTDGYVFCGNAVNLQWRRQAWMLQTDLSGNLGWNKILTGNPATSSNFEDFIMNADGSFTATGDYRSSPNLYEDLLLVKTGPVNQIKGTLFLDANTNGIKDAGELLFNNAIVKSQKSGFSITAQPNGGSFSFDVDTGSYTTTVQLFNPYYTVVPASKNSIFTTYFNMDSFGIAIQPIPNQQDLVVHLIPATPARPGFQSSYVLNYKNTGTTTIANGSVKFIKDSRSSLFGASPLPSSIVADTITWNYVNLKPLDSVTIGIQLQLAPPPTLNINDTLKLMAVILPVAGDITPADDTSRLRQRVIGSYDPNDKQESFAGRMPLKNVQDGSYINYVIRFQNTGTDTAFFVRLLDTLDTKLDWNSFQMIGSSHAYNLTIKDGNKLNWFFDNIKLPDSTTNLLKSNGYVAFRIKPKNNLLANDVISNKASIYFDYNLPVVTNTTNTVVFVDAATGVREIQNNEMKLVLGPNPANGYSLLQVSGKLTGKFELRVIDNYGRIISNQILTRNSIAETLQVPLNMQQLSSGVYYIQLQQKEKSWWQKLIVQ